MKRIIYLLLLVPFVLFQSCLKDEEDIFDAASSTRLHEAIGEYRTILTGAANGWVMEYYPESHQAYGGINILVKFNEDGTTTITNETGYSGSNLDTENSLYDVIAETGPVLTFNTYNPYIHLFADPDPDLTGSVDGYKGDYEFVIVSATPERVEMKGKKTQNVIVMTALDANTSWESYLEKVFETVTISESPKYQLYLDDEAIDTSKPGAKFSFSWAEGAEIKTTEASFLYTPTGLRFYQPVKIKNKEMQNFAFNASINAFECTDEGVNAKIANVFLPINEVFSTTMNKWLFDYSGLNATLKGLWDKAKASCFENEKETLQLIYLGYFSGTGGRGTSIGFMTDAYQAVTSATFSVVEGTEDQITITRTNNDYLNYSFYVKYFDPFADFIAENSPYKLVPDNEKSPNQITFTSVENPDATFTLFKQ